MKLETIDSDISLPRKMRKELKKPLGLLIETDPNQELLNIIKNEKPSLVIFVGDYCVKKMVEDKGFIPDISIIDGKNLREQFEKITIHNAKVIKAKNPPAKITREAWKRIEEAIASKINGLKTKVSNPILLIIDGEEDLLVFPAVLESPTNTFVVYGQPHKGLVLIKVTSNVKFKFKKLIERMKVMKNEDKNQ